MGMLNLRAFVESRLPRLGNTFLNVSLDLPGANRRSHSISGYIPYELSHAAGAQRSGQVPELPSGMTTSSTLESSVEESELPTWECAASNCSSTSSPQSGAEQLQSLKMPMRNCETFTQKPAERLEGLALPTLLLKNERCTPKPSTADMPASNKGSQQMSRRRAAALEEPKAPVRWQSGRGTGTMVRTGPGGSGSGRAKNMSLAQRLPEMEGEVTLMVRNLAPGLNQSKFIEELQRAGLEDLFDFAYLPCRLEGKRESQGFAFVNLTTPAAAEHLRSQWHGETIPGLWAEGGSPINLSLAELQGLEANLKRCENARMSRVRNRRLQPYVARSSALTLTSRPH